VRSVAAALSSLQIPGTLAVQYAESLHAHGVLSPDDLTGLSKQTLDACKISRQHRRRIRAIDILSDVKTVDMVSPVAADAPAPAAGPSLERAAEAGPADGSRETSSEEIDHGGDVFEFSVNSTFAGLRVDAALAQLLSPLSRTYFGTLCSEKLVLVDGVATKKSANLVEGSVVRTVLRATPELQVEPEDIELDALFEDRHMIAINKPAGMVVHPSPGHWSGTFVHALLHRVRGERDALPDELGDGLRPGIVHRLDRYTTGVLLAAKTSQAQQAMIKAFAERRVWKLYIAVCVGLPQSRTVVDEPIGRHPTDRLRMAVVPGGRPALSIVHRLASDSRRSLVAVLIRTGRTHQIRVHLQHLGCPILGDPVYGDTNWNKKEAGRVNSPLLHAYSVRLKHPITGEPLLITAPPSADITALADELTGCSPENFSDWLSRTVQIELAYSLDKFKF